MPRYDVRSGTRVDKAVAAMIALAKQSDELVTAEFNGVELTASPDDSVDDILSFYQTELERRNKEFIDSTEYKQREREREESDRRRELMLEGALLIAPDKMTLIDEDEWKEVVEQRADARGRAITLYAERWARLIEGRMANGGTLEGCVKEFMTLADSGIGIAGSMFGEAVFILAMVWVHGEQLRCWHNLRIQLGNEGELANASGEVLNPASIVIVD